MINITQEFNKLTAECLAERLEQANLASKNDITDFVKKTKFDDKLKNVNKTITSNKIKHVKPKKKLNDLAENVKIISTKGHNFLLARMYILGNNGYQNFLVFVPVLNSLTLDNSKKVTDWISIGVSLEKIKLFDTNLAPTMLNLANGRVSLKFNNSVLVQKNSSSLYVTSF